MNTIREASIEDSQNNRNLVEQDEIDGSYFKYNVEDFTKAKQPHIYLKYSKKSNNKSDPELNFTSNDEKINTSLKSKSNLSLLLTNLFENKSPKAQSKSSICSQDNKLYTESSDQLSKSVTTSVARKANLKQRIRRFNSSLENRMIYLKQSNDINNSNKNPSYKSTLNKIQVENKELIDEAIQVKCELYQDENLDIQTPPEKTNTNYFLKLDSNKSNIKLSGKSMNSIYDQTNKYSNENLYLNTKLNSTSLTNVDLNNTVKISDSKSQTDLFKKASYQKPIAKDAVKTSLKNLNKENDMNNIDRDSTIYTNGEPVSTTKTMITSKNTNDNSDTTNTTTIATTKTIVNDMNRKKSLSKRRNTISSITFINNAKSNSSSVPNENMVQNNSDKKVNKINANELMEISETNIFDIIEKEDIEYLKKKLIVSPQYINSINEYDMTPLDTALMLNNNEIITILIKNGAIENPSLPDWNDRYDRICTRLTDLDISLRHFLKTFDVSALTNEKIEEYDNMLKDLDFKMRLSHRMKYLFENMNYPGEVKNIILEVQSPTSLLVRFKEPDDSQNSFIIKYLIEWSSNSTFEPLDGQIVLSFVDTDEKEYLISNLVMFKVYYVRVCCANVKGYGPYSPSDPPFGIPSYWRDGNTIHEKLSTQIKKLNELYNEIKLSKNNLEFVNQNLLNQLQKFSKSKKSSGLKRNLKTIFTLALATTSLNSSTYSNVNVNSLKFAKQIKKCSAYLVCVFYDGDKVVTTLDDNLPMIEIDENYSFQNLNSDFQFLVKLSFNWNDIENFKNQIEQSITTSSLRFRYLTLCVLKQMQNIFELNDLGRVYYNCIKNNTNGSVFFVLVKKLINPLNQNMLKINQIDKLIDKNMISPTRDININSNTLNNNVNNFNKNNEDTTFLLKYLKLIIDYDLNSETKLTKGFYVAYLKLQSSIELIKVMVPFKIPNSLPCEKVRENQNVSREEWNLLKSVKFSLDKLSMNELNSINFVKQIYEAINRLFKKFDLNNEEMQNLRLITRELIEVNEDITLLLICPTVEQTCIMQVTDDSIQPFPIKIHNDFEYIHIPVQLFEAIHLGIYNLEFIKTYVKLSVLLEFEFFASNQFNREAFSNQEIELSKKILTLVSKYQRSLEDIWKESRWLINCINNARDKLNQQNQNLIQFSDLKKFLDQLIVNDCKNGCCTCQMNTNIFDYNNNISRKNIYNHITQLPQITSCNCDKERKKLKNMLTSIGLKNSTFNHIDSILVEDEDLDFDKKLDYTEQVFKENFGSIEDLTKRKEREKCCNFCEDCIKNCVNCQKNKSLNSLNSIDFCQKNSFNPGKIFGTGTDSKTINKLVSKLYISASTTPSTPKNLSTEDLSRSKTSIDYKLLNPELSQNSFTSSACSVYSNSTNPIIKEHIIESPLSTSSSSGYYSSKNDSNLPSPSFVNKIETWQYLNFNGNTTNKKLNVFVDFETGLKIDLNFECTINGQTTCKDLIYYMIKKINSFIASFNQANKVFNDNLSSDSNGSFSSAFDFRTKQTSSSNLNKDFNFIQSLDENTNLYYLVVCLKSSYSNEKVLSNSYVLSNLKEPWLNGVIHLRNNSKIYKKKNIQQF